MKVTTILASLVVGLAGVGLAQAAEAPANRTDVQVASAGHDPYYPEIVLASSRTRAAIVKELQQARINTSSAGASHNPYYPMHFIK